MVDPIQEYFNLPGHEPGFFVAAGHAEGVSPSSLVKAAKSPTHEKPRELTDIRTPKGQPGAFAVLQFREWSDEWRVRTRAEPLTFQAPIAPAGPRVTDTLTVRGARKIMESCQYVAETAGGYSTFLTLTLDTAARCRWQTECVGPFSCLGERVTHLAGDPVPGAEGAYCKLGLPGAVFPGDYSQEDRKAAAALVESTIQAEVSRFFDALQKAYARGMVETCPKTGATVRIPAEQGALQYVWVAEIPDTVDQQTGEVGPPNPHVHVLMRWRVPGKQFRAWAARIERLWGQGFAHLEKIKDGTAAAAYMMKAAGYLCKAQGKADQGRIRGNRYGISKPARAPDWVTVQEYDLHIMGALIADVYQRCSEVYGEDYGRRRALREALDRAPKGQRVRRVIGKKLEQVRAKIKAVPVVASKYQLILRGAGAAAEFMAWARDPSGNAPLSDWLPQKERGEAWRPGENRPDTAWFARWKELHYWRRAVRAAWASGMFGWSDTEFRASVPEYEQWAALAA